MDIITIFEDIAPSLFADVAIEKIERFITRAQGRLSVTQWGDCYAEGVAYLAAHYLELSVRASQSGSGGSAPGAVTSRAAGDVSIGYGGTGGTYNRADAALAQTPYGLAFIELRDSLAAGTPFLVEIC